MSTKIFRDPIYKSIELPDYCMKIIDTPEFQRLRHIKQLGYVEAVYPGGTHSRFEHSLGTCYLAGKVIRTLQEKQPALNITDHDIKLVEIAGLCHDLGHGPFSHKFEDVVETVTGKKWNHERASGEILKFISRGLESNIKLDEADIDIICKIIDGKADICSGEEKEKRRKFMYQIVNNEKTGIDVDKWDYFSRDSYHLGIKTDFDHDHLLSFLRVVEVEGNYEIGFRDKETETIASLFDTRWKLHRRVYQHRVTGLLEEMINDVMIGYFRYTENLEESKQKSEFVLSKIISGMDNPSNEDEWKQACQRYCQLDDRILYKIVLSTEDELKPARELYRQIQERKLYHLVAVLQSKVPLMTSDTESGGEISEQSVGMNQAEVNPISVTSKISKKHIIEITEEFHDDQFAVVEHRFRYGKGAKHPLFNAHFYNKKAGDNTDEIPKGIPKGIPIQVPPTMPREDQLEFTVFRVYTKHEPKTNNLRKEIADQIKRFEVGLTPEKNENKKETIRRQLKF